MNMIEYDDKKGAISILNKSRYSIFGYLNPSSTIVDLHKKYEPDKIDSILEKQSKVERLKKPKGKILKRKNKQE